MKIFKVAIPFWQHWLQVYAEHPELSNQSWMEQQVTISENWFGFPHIWKYALKSLGYEVIEVFANVDVVQKRWAIENRITYNDASWSYDIAKAQIIKEKPDILFVADLFWFSYDWIQEVRQCCPSIKLVLGWFGAPIEDESILNSCDLVLSCIPELVEKCRSNGLNSQHLNHAFDPRVLPHIDSSSDPEIDLSFVGNVRRNLKFDSGREKILVALTHYTNIQIFSSAIHSQEKLPQLLKLFLKSNIYSLTHFIQALRISQESLIKLPILRKVAKLDAPPMRSVNPQLVPYLKQPVYGVKMFQTLCNSKLTLNKHIDASPLSASNMRMYEATGVGTCLVTDHKENIRDLFEPDFEVVTYRSKAECIEKIEWLLKHPEERLKIAQAGQARTLKDHTLDQRALQFDNIIRQAIKRLATSV